EGPPVQPFMCYLFNLFSLFTPLIRRVRAERAGAIDRTFKTGDPVTEVTTECDPLRGYGSRNGDRDAICKTHRCPQGCLRRPARHSEAVSRGRTGRATIHIASVLGSLLPARLARGGTGRRDDGRVRNHARTLGAVLRQPACLTDRPDHAAGLPLEADREALQA